MIRQCLAILGCFAALATPTRAEPVFTLAKSPAGVEFWYRLRTDVPKAMVFAGWPDGLGMMTPGKEALVPFARSVVERGCGGRSANALSEAMQDLAANGGLSGDVWETHATLQAPPENMASAGKLVASCLTAPNLEQKEIDRARGLQAASMRQAQAKSENTAQLAADRWLYRGQSILRRLEPSALDAISREDMELWRKRVFTREKIVIAASGNLTAEAFGAVIDNMAADLPKTSDLPVAERSEPQIRPRTIVIERDQPQTILLLMTDTSLKSDRDQLRASLAVRVLGGGFESRITGNVRQKLGAAYNIGAGLQGTLKHRLLTMGGPVDNDKAPAALAAILEEYAHWHAEGVTQEEFDSATKRSLDQLNVDYARVGFDASSFVSAILSGRPPNDTADYEARLTSYTRDGVNDDIAHKFSATPFLTIIVAPKAEPFKADCVVKDWREVDSCQ